MNASSHTFADAAAERLLMDHLNAIDAALRRSGSPVEARRQIVDDVRAQVRETVWGRVGENPRVEDVAAVLAELDPPEAYGGEQAAAGVGGREVLPPETARAYAPNADERRGESTPAVWVVDFRLLKTLVWWEIGFNLLALVVGIVIAAVGSRTSSKADAAIALFHFGLMVVFVPALIVSYIGLLRRWIWARWLYVATSLGGLIFMLTPGESVGSGLLDFFGAVTGILTGVIIALILTTPVDQLYGRRTAQRG